MDRGPASRHRSAPGTEGKALISKGLTPTEAAAEQTVFATSREASTSAHRGVFPAPRALQ